MINLIISNYSKLAQRKYKTRYIWIGKGIHWELCNKIKFDHTYNRESVLKNETQKISWILRYKRII